MMDRFTWTADDGTEVSEGLNHDQFVLLVHALCRSQMEAYVADIEAEDISVDMARGFSTGKIFMLDSFYRWISETFEVPIDELQITRTSDGSLNIEGIDEYIIYGGDGDDDGEPVLVDEEFEGADNVVAISQRH